jgi:tetratricopeptide (TPR) repeat protein
MPNNDVAQTHPTSPTKRGPNLLWLLFGLFSVSLIAVMGVLGAYGGYQTSQQEYQGLQGTQAVLLISEQYELGVQDIEAGRFDLARQRFEYVLERDPNHTGAADNLLIALQVLYATATPTPVPPTITPTPTPDLRPIEDLFSQALSYYETEDWNGVIDTLINLRKVDQSYRVVEVDSLLYRTLRIRGINKIRNESNLEGGIYDLSLAERFGPIDAEANKWRNFARIYMIGSSFWEVDPFQAVYFFGQVASAAPYLRDASGWTARERYRAALIQYGDMLARNGKWCEAETQYNLAIDVYSNEVIIPTVSYLALKCSPPTSPPEDTATITLTPTVTYTIDPGITPTEALTPTETISLPTQETTPTETPLPQMTDTPGIEETPTPTPTVSPTIELQPSATNTLPPPDPSPTQMSEPTPTAE